MSLSSKRDNKIKIRTCRICLDAKNEDRVLLEEQNGWLRLFEYCFGLTLTSQDEPRLLCQICAEKVQIYAEFKEKCQKSHNLWKSVISEVKCYVIKHQNFENNNQYVSDPLTRIKDESLIDASLDNDFCNEYETVYFPPDDDADVKTEMVEDDMKLKDEESLTNLNGNDVLVTKAVSSKRKKCKEKYNDDSVKCMEKKMYTCVKCKIQMHETRRYYLEHLKKCQQKIPKRLKRRIFDHDFAYQCGRKYDAENISKMKHESQSDSDIHVEREIVGVQSDPLFLCGLCKLSFNTSKDMCVHLNDHWSNNDLACKLCDFIGVDLAATAAHRYAHFLLKGSLRFLCHICEKSKYSLLALHFHYRREHLNKTGGYCSRCNREYTKLRNWKKHELINHSKRRYICDFCGKGFFYKHTIEEHVINHMQLNKCICDICGNTFSRRRYLAVHKETVHSISGPLNCTHCQRVFKSKFTLAKHQKIVSREKTLKCEVCHKSFVTPNVLKLHMVMHSDERPYRCDVCDCSYKYKSNLTAHLLKHTEFSSHKCSMCTKTFASAIALKRHSSVHTGIRRYSCSVTNCVRSFHSKKLLLAHIELRHKNENVAER